MTELKNLTDKIMSVTVYDEEEKENDTKNNKNANIFPAKLPFTDTRSLSKRKITIIP